MVYGFVPRRLRRERDLLNLSAMPNKTLIALAALPVAFAIACSGNTATNDATPVTTTTTTVVAEPDVPGADSIRALIRDVYAVISGPAGQERDWDRMRTMFAPNARLSAMVPRRQNDTITAPHPTMVMMSVEDYIQRSGPMLMRDGFFETELYSEIERYGNVAHVWSTYDSRLHSPDSAVIDRGINSFQLVYGDGRWWVYSILWHSERAGAGTIPDRYLDN